MSKVLFSWKLPNEMPAGNSGGTKRAMCVDKNIFEMPM